MAKLVAGFVLLALTVAGPAAAQFNPDRVIAPPEAVQRHYPDPDVSLDTPGFADNRKDFTSHRELMEFVQKLAAKSGGPVLEVIGGSQQGRAIPALVYRKPGGEGRPLVLFVGLQHGNEPAGGEGALALAERLTRSPHSKLLETVDVVIVPRANPDGAEKFVRATANDIDVNRDHLLLATPEGRALAALALKYRPVVAVDMHEFTVGDRWLAKFGGYAKYDALLQAATVGNLPEPLQSAAADVVDAARNALQNAGHTVFWYHTGRPDAEDKRVFMGGVQPDTGRNVYGLRNAVSVLLETRGVGLGRIHFKRRVYSHVLAAEAVLAEVGRRADEVVRRRQQAERAVSAEACKGAGVVRAEQVAGNTSLDFIHAKTGEPLKVEVPWLSSLELKIVETRPRPCAYVLAPDQLEAAKRLAQLGAAVHRLGRPATADAESYAVTANVAGKREDGRGAINDANAIRIYTVTAKAGRQTFPAGSFYISMAQPLANLIWFALEPDSQNSFAANHIASVEGITRVMQPLTDTALEPYTAPR